MTAKQFEVIDYFDSENKSIKAIRDNGTTEIYSMDNELEANSTCEKLNALHEENTQLKEGLKELKEIGDYQAQRIQELNNENQHIKNTIQTMKETERTQMGQSVLKQLWEQIQC